MASTDTETACPTAAAVSPLLSLPTELLLEICHHIQGLDDSLPQIPEPSELWAQHQGGDVREVRELQWQQRRERVADLLALSKTCRRLRAIAEPFLYASVSVRTGCDFDDADEDIAACDRFSSFVRTLANRPDLGRRVRHLDAPCSAATIFDDNDDVLRDLFRAVPNLATVHLFVGWLRRLVPSEDESDAPAPLPPMPPDGPPQLPASVHTLRLSGPDHGYELHLDYPIFQHSGRSTLRMLELFGCSAVRSACLPDSVSAVPTLFHDLTILNLRHTTMDAASFQRLLQTVGPGLASVWISVPREDYADRRLNINGVLFGKIRSAVCRCLRALLPWSHTLRSFAYTVQDHYTIGLDMDYMSELANFSVLESLWLEARCFNFSAWGDPWAVLPPMLKALRVSGRSAFDGAVEQLLACIKEGRFPHLKYLALDIEDSDRGRARYNALVTSVCRLSEAGVCVTILPYVAYYI